MQTVLSIAPIATIVSIISIASIVSIASIALYTTKHKKKSRLQKKPELFLMKEGGYLLSRIALQYHRRKRA